MAGTIWPRATKPPMGRARLAPWTFQAWVATSAIYRHAGALVRVAIDGGQRLPNLDLGDQDHLLDEARRMRGPRVAGLIGPRLALRSAQG